nr:hypothetical protein HmN_000295700 [Hymenolepis microstoma]
MPDLDIIRRSFSNWSSALHLASTRSGELRPCADCGILDSFLTITLLLMDKNSNSIQKKETLSVLVAEFLWLEQKISFTTLKVLAIYRHLRFSSHMPRPHLALILPNLHQNI